MKRKKRGWKGENEYNLHRGWQSSKRPEGRPLGGYARAGQSPPQPLAAQTSSGKASPLQPALLGPRAGAYRLSTARFRPLLRPLLPAAASRREPPSSAERAASSGQRAAPWSGPRSPPLEAVAATRPRPGPAPTGRAPPRPDQARPRSRDPSARRSPRGSTRRRARCATGGAPEAGEALPLLPSLRRLCRRLCRCLPLR